VRGLILWQAISDYKGAEAAFLASVAAENWERALVMLAQTFLPGVELGTALSVMRACCTREDWIKQSLAAEAASVESVLTTLHVPALLLYKTVAFRETAVLARKMATGIAGSRLVFLDDDGDLYGYPRDSTKLIEHVATFAGSVGVEIENHRPAKTDHADSAQPLSNLTARELQVLRLIVDGGTNKEIARELTVSERTIARHITNLYAKIDARSKADATAYALRNGFC
jgi:DNA-binding CsgD family transcriptional regulator